MRNKSILFVEDEVSISQTVVAYLNKSFNVIAAMNGCEALEQHRENSFDCIVLDIEMPVMNGIEFLTRLRKSGVNTPVIVATGNSRTEYAEKVADLIVHGYITKPYNCSELVERIITVTSKARRVGDKGYAMQQNLHPKLKEVMEYVDENYQRNLSLSILSKKIGMSYSRLAELFKNEIGMSFTCYVNRLRVGKAKLLVKNTDFTISEIMTEVGFQTEPHFFKQFKRFTGATPKSLRS